MEYNKQHFKFDGYDLNMNKRFVPKKSYPDEIMAQRECFMLNMNKHTIHKVVCYKCDVCGKWHIGHHSGKQLTEQDRSRISKQFEKFKFVHNLNNS